MAKFQEVQHHRRVGGEPEFREFIVRDTDGVEFARLRVTQVPSYRIDITVNGQEEATVSAMDRNSVSFEEEIEQGQAIADEAFGK